VAVGQQCARRPVPLPAAVGKLVVASAVAAIVMALLGVAGGGRLGNFGDVGIDQTTFGPAVFLWFTAIGALTVVMSSGIARRPKARATPAATVAQPDSTPDPESEPLPVSTGSDVEPDVEDVEEVEDVFAEIVVDESEELRPAFDEPMARPAPVRIPPRDVFDLDDDPEAHFFTDDDAASDEPRRSSD
jgi:hypothetical protein